MTCLFKMVIQKSVNFVRLFHVTKVLKNPSIKGLTSLSNNILHAAICFTSSNNINKIRYLFYPRNKTKHVSFNDLCVFHAKFAWKISLK